MGYFSELDIIMRNGYDWGLDIDFNVRIGSCKINVHDLAEKLKGVVARNGDILYPGWSGEKSARVIFDENAKLGYRLSDAYGLDADDRRLQDANFRAIVGLKPGERIETCDDEWLRYVRWEALAKREAVANALWEKAQPAPGTIVQRYLKSRGITVPLPTSLRAGMAWHPDERTEYPGMIAEVSDPVSGKPQGGVHCTALRRDGSGKANITSNAKWTTGNIKGGIIRLSEPKGDRIAIAEGIETALSFAQLTGIPAWAALNAGNLTTLKLPTSIRYVAIAADNDKPNEERGGYNLGLQAARRARDRFRSPGRVIEILAPKVAGCDWNDVLRGRSS